MNYLREFKIESDETMIDVTTRKNYFKDVMYFYCILFDQIDLQLKHRLGYIDLKTGQYICNFRGKIGYVPSFIPKIERMRFLLMSYFTRANEIQVHIHQLHKIFRLFPWERSRDNKKIEFEEWQELSKYIPMNRPKELTQSHPAWYFNDVIYNLESHPVHG